jgi:acyl carrier protein
MNQATVRETLRTFVTAELMDNPSYPLRDDEPLVTGGLIDSMAFVQIALFIEETFGVFIPDDDLTIETVDTLDALVERIMRESPHAV